MAESSSVFGLHTVRAVLTRRAAQVQRVIVQDGRVDDRVAEVLKLARDANIKIERKSAAELDKLAAGERHQGVVADLQPAAMLGEGALDELLERVRAPLLLVLDGVQDPHNLGACLRTADAAGVSAVIVPRDRAVGLTPVVRKVASGAAESVPLIQVTNLARTLRWLKEREFWIIGADEAGEKNIYQVNYAGATVIVMGAEGQGLRRLTLENCDFVVKIPMAGLVESLNVSVATGIMLFEAVRQREARRP